MAAEKPKNPLLAAQILLAADKKKRIEERMRRLKANDAELRCVVKAVIVADGNMAVAQVVIEALD